MRFAFYISLLISLLKLLEIALSSKQQDNFQKRLEDITLWVSDVNFRFVFDGLKARRNQIWLAFGFPFFALVVTFSLMSIQGKPSDVVSEMGTLTFVVWFVAQLFLSLLVLPIELRWLLAKGTMLSFACRAGIVLLTTSLALALTSHFKDAFIDLVENLPLSYLIVSFAILPFAFLSGLGLYSLAFVAIMKIFQVLLWVAQTVLWKLVQYPKGAWSGLLFLLTGVLGVIQLMFSNAPK